MSTSTTAPLTTGAPTAPTQTTVSTEVGRFAAGLTLDDVPEAVLDRVRYLALDAVGVALASAQRDFAHTAAAALLTFGSGDCPVLGRADKLAARDAAILNGVLVHGLDYDDTHLGAVTHLSASALPTAISAAVAADRSAADLLLGYVLGLEISARVGLGGAGLFHDAGFHPTAIAGAFGSAVSAARLAGLDAAGIATAQGVVGSMSAGLLEFLEDGAWTKRLHPGWAASSGLTAAAFAGAGWVGPQAVYEGRFGLYATHLQAHAQQARPDAIVDGLGTTWECARAAVKPYAACHFTHSFIDAALALRKRGADPARITRITAAIHPIPGKVVAEPLRAKQVPVSEYDAKFSLPFTVAAALVRGRFGLAELETDAREDQAILALCQRVDVVADTESAFPDAYSGALEVELDDGTVLSHREQINRGHSERPLTNDDIVAKFRVTTADCVDGATQDRVQQCVLGLGRDDGSARVFAETLAVR